MLYSVPARGQSSLIVRVLSPPIGPFCSAQPVDWRKRPVSSGTIQARMMGNGIVSSLHRRTAFILGLVCLWISTAGMLHHDADDLLGLLASQAAHASYGHAGPIAPEGTCAACEWGQTVGSSHAPSVFVVTLPALMALVYRQRIDGPTFQCHSDVAWRRPAWSCRDQRGQ